MKESDAIDYAQLWRCLFVFGDLLRAVAKGDSDDRWMSRVTVSQARIFGYILSRPDEVIRLKTLARDLSVSPAAASQSIDRLVKAGYVTREPDAEDRRAVQLHCTAAGAAFYYGLRDRSIPVLRATLEKESPEAVAVFKRVLEHLFGDVRRRWNDLLDNREQASRKPTDSTQGNPS